MAAASYKVLAQVAPTTTSETLLYLVPGGYQAVASTLSLCNITAAVVKVSINVCPAGVSSANKHAFLRSTSVAPGTTATISVGMTLAQNDVVRIILDTANGVAAHLYGTEIG